MTVGAFVGQLLVAVSPSLALFSLGVTRDARQTVLAIGGAFFWMLAALLASALWYAAGPMQRHAWFTLLCAVLLQELVRAAFARLVGLVERRMSARSGGKRELPPTVATAFAAGVGAALAYVCVVCVPVLVEGIGPGTLFAPACPATSLFTLAALHAALFSLLQVLLSVLAFVAYERHAWVLVAFVWLSHYAASYFVRESSSFFFFFSFAG